MSESFRNMFATPNQRTVTAPRMADAVAQLVQAQEAPVAPAPAERGWMSTPLWKFAPAHGRQDRLPPEARIPVSDVPSVAVAAPAARPTMAAAVAAPSQGPQSLDGAPAATLFGYAQDAGGPLVTAMRTQARMPQSPMTFEGALKLLSVTKPVTVAERAQESLLANAQANRSRLDAEIAKLMDAARPDTQKIQDLQMKQEAAFEQRMRELGIPRQMIPYQ